DTCLLGSRGETIPMKFRMWRWPLLLIAAIALLRTSTAAAQAPLFQDGFDGPEGSRPTSWRAVGAEDPEYWKIRDGRLDSGNGDDYADGLTWFVSQTNNS